MITAKRFETDTARALKDPDALPTPAQARETYAAIRERFGFVRRAGAFTSADIGKFAEGKGRVIMGHALAPFTESGMVNLCAFEDHCADGCVAGAGNGAFHAVKSARSARVALWCEDPGAAYVLLRNAIRNAVKRFGADYVAMRLNTFSDVRWERVLPLEFWREFAAVAFYDYTKHPLRSRPASTMPANYRLTYSVSPRTTPAQVAAQRSSGRSVAVVIATRGGKLRSTGAKRPLPSWDIPAPVVDGDANDRRYADPAGAVVALRRKGTLRADSALVRDPESLF